jgi:copper homeostasis protein
VGVLVEAAVDTIAGAVAAEREGAGRLELCADLPRGGVTPSAGLLRAIRARMDLPIHVMIRPRPGDFLFTAPECEAMRWDIAEARRAGADGIVLGLLTRDGWIEREWTAKLTAEARPMSVTFHRAVDATPDVAVAIEVLASLGIDRVLTSGGATTALQGAAMLKRLIQAFGARMGILPGGQVRAANAAEIVRATGARELHVGFPGEAEAGRIAEVASALSGL